MSTNKDLTLRQKVEALLADKNITSYRIAKEMGVYVNSIDHLRRGDGEIGNIRLDMAERYAALYDKINEGEKVESESKL